MTADPLRFPMPGGDPPPEPPEHLSEPMREWWRAVHGRCVLQSHHVEILRRACECWDLSERAREILDTEGPTTVDRFGQVKPHPAATVWKENVNAFRLLVRELGLDKLPDEPRAPRLY